MDSLPIDQATADRIVEEANHAFGLNMHVFKELEGNLILAIGKTLFGFLTRRQRAGSTEGGWGCSWRPQPGHWRPRRWSPMGSGRPPFGWGAGGFTCPGCCGVCGGAPLTVTPIAGAGEGLVVSGSSLLPGFKGT